MPAPPTDRPVGWGVVSTGHIASVVSADLALLTDEARLVAVSSRDLDRARQFAQTHGFARAYASAAELAMDPEVDVIYVASVHNDHFASARACLEAGKPVLVEKPMTISAAETAELLALAEASGLFAMEAVWTRTNPLIRRAVDLVRAGEIGEIHHVSANFGFAYAGPSDHRLLDPARAGGAILDLGVYPAHLAELFLGEPSAIAGFGFETATWVDAHATAVLNFPATGERPAATADILCSIAVTTPTSLTIYGSTGRISFDDFFVLPKRMTIHRLSSEPETITGDCPGGGYAFELREVMRCLRAGEQQSPMVPWQATRTVSRILDQWRAAIAQPDPADHLEHHTDKGKHS